MHQLEALVFMGYLTVEIRAMKNDVEMVPG
jgi:hypothetical protein